MFQGDCHETLLHISSLWQPAGEKNKHKSPAMYTLRQNWRIARTKTSVFGPQSTNSDCWIQRIQSTGNSLEQGEGVGDDPQKRVCFSWIFISNRKVSNQRVAPMKQLILFFHYFPAIPCVLNSNGTIGQLHCPWKQRRGMPRSEFIRRHSFCGRCTCKWCSFLEIPIRF